MEILLGHPRGAEVLEGLEIILSRDPRQGQLVPETAAEPWTWASRGAIRWNSYCCKNDLSGCFPAVPIHATSGHGSSGKHGREIVTRAHLTDGLRSP